MSSFNSPIFDQSSGCRCILNRLLGTPPLWSFLFLFRLLFIGNCVLFCPMETSCCRFCCLLRRFQGFAMPLSRLCYFRNAQVDVQCLELVVQLKKDKMPDCMSLS